MQKLYYSIREVSELVDEEQHILRYWEKEFSELSPKKNRGGNRIYSEKDIAIIKKIKFLLREDKLSLKGAKEQLIIFLNSELNFQSTKLALQNSHLSSEVIDGTKDELHASQKYEVKDEKLIAHPITVEESKLNLDIVDKSALLDVRNFLQELLVEIRN